MHLVHCQSLSVIDHLPTNQCLSSMGGTVLILQLRAHTMILLAVRSRATARVQYSVDSYTVEQAFSRSRSHTHAHALPLPLPLSLPLSLTLTLIMNLPEVVPDPLPQSVTKDEAFFYHVYAHERSPKFVAWVPAGQALGPPGRVQDPSPVFPAPLPLVPPLRLPRLPESQRKAFWVFLGGALVVLAAGIGGIVGGCIVATKLKRQDHSADTRWGGPYRTYYDLQTYLSTPSRVSSYHTEHSTRLTCTHPRPSLPPVSVAVSAAATPRPTSSPTPTLANQTAPQSPTTQPRPSFAFQGFADDNYTGTATPLIHREGFADLPFACHSYRWRPNDTSCCITFCQNHTHPAGWLCADQIHADADADADVDAAAAATPFPRIWIGCGSSAAAAEHSCL